MRLPSSLSRLRRTGPAGIDREVLHEVEQRVVDLERAAADHDRPLHALRLDAGVAIAELLVEAACGVVGDPVAQADTGMAARCDPFLGGEHHRFADPLAPSL